MKAILLLEDGTVFEGKGFGATGAFCGEVVFNTSMTGYQEITTDPSYNEQIITMTYPLIGNYGTNSVDVESDKCYARGFIVKEACPYPSNWRSEDSLDGYMKANNVVGLSNIDTRKLVRLLRDKGAMRGIISNSELEITKLQTQLDTYPGLVGRDIVSEISTKEPYQWTTGIEDVVSGEIICPEVEYKVVAYDYGVKKNILRLLRSHGFSVKVVPADMPAEEVLAMNPDGVFLSNGPGDPAAVEAGIKNTKALLGKVPIFGICLGHQILSLALGASSYKLKFGHRGANHPVKNLETGKIEITSQNHGFCIDLESIGDKVEATHINLNDNTLAGIKCKHLPAFAVQYHPEASPGPHDSRYLFESFKKLIKDFKA
ncbi:MAG: glutamine-hydrolyzing carbamoyl-phosphate synthase small subunit [Phycisphaerae bacterium]